MQEARVLIDESLQTELVRRVMALEGREETLRLSNLHLESTIETLTEYTSVSPVEIRKIADELARAATISVSDLSAGNAARPITPSKIMVVGVGLIALVGMSMWAGRSFLAPTPAEITQLAPTELPSSMEADIDGIFLKRSIFFSAFSDFSAIRNLVMMHFYDTGEFPNNLAQMGLDSDSLVSGNIRELQVGHGGAIVVHLSEKMGENSRIKMTPKIVMGGHSVEWNCTSNLPVAVLSGTPCERAETI